MTGIASAAIMGGMALAGSVGSGLIAKGSAGAAAGQSAAASREAQAAAQHQQVVNRSDASPWVSTGTSAIGQIGALQGYGSLWNRGGEGATYGYETDPNAYGNALANLRNYAGASGATLPGYSPVNYLTQVSDRFQADPSYAFRVREGNRALDRSASAKGNMFSGGQLKALTNYNSDVASQEYGNWWNRFLNQSEFNRAANQQNFGQQQTLYQDQYGQWRDALGDLFKTAGMVAPVQGNLASTDTSLTNSANNALVSGANNAANYTARGGEALASGIGSGVNSLISAAAYGGVFGGWANNNGNYSDVGELMRAKGIGNAHYGGY